MNTKLGLLFFVLTFLATTFATTGNNIALAASAPVKPCSDVFEYNGEAYFCAEHRSQGKEVFRSNGQPEGTIVLRDIDPGPGSSSPSGFFKLNGFLFFVAENTATGWSLWRTDGTTENTNIVASLTDVAPYDYLQFQVVARDDGRVFLQLSSRLYVTDGTTEGTKKLDAAPTSGFGSSLSYWPKTTYFLDGDSLFYVKYDTLYRVSISGNTSTMVFSFPAVFDGCGYNTKLDEEASAPGRLIVNHSTSACGDGTRSLWISDGSPAGTKQTSPSEVRTLATLENGVLLCSLVDSAYLTLSGNRLVNLRAGFDDGSFCQSSSVAHIHNGVAYFRQYDGITSNYSLWGKDLSARAPKKIASMKAGSFVSIGNDLYMASNVDGNATLFSFDSSGLALSQEAVFNNQVMTGIHQVNNQLFMIFYQVVSNPSPSSGFRRDLIVRKLQRGGSPVLVKRALGQGKYNSARTWNEGGRLYFQLNSESVLWHSNGTSASTYPLTYLVPDRVVTPEQELAAKLTSIIYLLLLDDEEPVK